MPRACAQTCWMRPSIASTSRRRRCARSVTACGCARRWLHGAQARASPPRSATLPAATSRSASAGGAAAPASGAARADGSRATSDGGTLRPACSPCAPAARRRWLMARTTLRLARALCLALIALRAAAAARPHLLIWRRRRTSQLLPGCAMAPVHAAPHEPGGASGPHARDAQPLDELGARLCVLRAIPYGNDEEAVNALCALGGNGPAGAVPSRLPSPN